MNRLGMAASAIAITAGALAPAGAEVRITRNSIGAVLGTEVFSDPARNLIWSPIETSPGSQLLNPLGDNFKDGLPTCNVLALPADDPIYKHGGTSLRDRGGPGDPQPKVYLTSVVVWSHVEDGQRRLVFSAWDYRFQSWRRTRSVEPEAWRADDEDPQMQVSGGIAYLLWRRGGTLLLSLGRLSGSDSSYDVIWKAPEVIGPWDPSRAPLEEILAQIIAERSGVPPVVKIPI